MIRAARDEDAGALAGLFNALNGMDGATPPVPMTPAILRRVLICPEPRARLFVAEHAGAAAGFVTGAPVYDAARGGMAMMLLDLYVAPAARRRGLGRALVARLAAAALAEGAACLWWGVEAGDEAASLFYRAIGARSEGPYSGEILEGAALAALVAGEGR